jgi:transposase
MQEPITRLARAFLEPTNATHRQYEALRAYFVGGLPSHEAAERFGYTPGSFRVLCHQFRQNPRRQLFITPVKGPAPRPKKKNHLRQQIIAMRKQNLSIYDISRSLKNLGHHRSPTVIAKILKEEGFARLPRRKDEPYSCIKTGA